MSFKIKVLGIFHLKERGLWILAGDKLEGSVLSDTYGVVKLMDVQCE
jgi:hypothetical protein